MILIGFILQQETGVGNLGLLASIHAMNDYERIARIIEHLALHFREQPDLDSLADLIGLSPFYFHRLFRRWAGTTPKQFIRHLTAIEAGRLLRGGHNILDTAYEVGLSGPGRLHDLCLDMEAATPGEVREGGKGWDMHAGYTSTPFGQALIATSPRGICRLAFTPDLKSRKEEWAAVQASWPHAMWIRDDSMASDTARSLFQRPLTEAKTDPIRLYVVGTEFQTKVWRALIRLPAGEVCSYADLGQKIGSPQGNRAVGGAVGRNPIGFLIPCHRVIQSTGAMGGYRWGVTRKKAILAWEYSQGLLH